MEDILSLLNLGSLFTLIISLCLIVGALLVYSIKILPEKKNRKTMTYLFGMLFSFIVAAITLIYLAVNNLEVNLPAGIFLMFILAVLGFFVCKIGIDFPKIKDYRLFKWLFFFVFASDILVIGISAWANNSIISIIRIAIVNITTLFSLPFFVYFFIFIEKSSKKELILSWKNRRKNGKKKK